ncbi:hypothetical protein HK102_002440, partial [Quaeritorhiza haematococci]
MAVGDRKVCCKLFNTGCLHITGCTSLDEVCTAANILIDRLHRIRGVSLVRLQSAEPPFVAYDHLVYAQSGLLIGYRDKEGHYVIHKEKMDLVDGRVWMSRDFLGKQKTIYNLDGIEIGRAHQTDQGLKYVWISGAPIAAAQAAATGTLLHPIRIFAADQKPFQPSDFEIHMINAFLKCPYKIRRSVLNKALTANGHYVRYNPSSYPEVNLRYYNNDLNETDFVDIVRQTWWTVSETVLRTNPAVLGVAHFNKTVYENCVSSVSEVSFIHELTSVTYIHDLETQNEPRGKKEAKPEPNPEPDPEPDPEPNPETVIMDKVLTKNKDGVFVTPLVDGMLMVRFKLTATDLFRIDSENCQLMVLLPSNQLFRCRLITGLYDLDSLVDMMAMVVNGGRNGVKFIFQPDRDGAGFTISAKEPFGLLVENEKANFLQRMTHLKTDILKQKSVHIGLVVDCEDLQAKGPGDLVVSLSRDHWTDWIDTCQIPTLHAMVPNDNNDNDDNNDNGVMNSLKNNVKEYVTLTKEIKEAKGHIKLLSARVTELEGELVQFMKSHDIHSLQISNGKINLYESKTVKPLNRDILTQTIAQKLDPSVAKELVESAFESRPTTSISKIRIVRD